MIFGYSNIMGHTILGTWKSTPILRSSRCVFFFQGGGVWGGGCWGWTEGHPISSMKMLAGTYRSQTYMRPHLDPLQSGQSTKGPSSSSMSVWGSVVCSSQVHTELTFRAFVRIMSPCRAMPQSWPYSRYK